MRTMVRKTVLVAVIIAASALPGASAFATSRSDASMKEERFARELDGFIQQLRAPSFMPPGTAVIVLRGDRTIFEKAYGTRDNRSNAPLTLDTPMYNASVTKAYTAILAAMLDEEGTLPLSASLPEIWRGLSLPAPLDAKAVTLAKLLSHSSGIREGGLNFRSVWTGQISAKAVPQQLARYAQPGRNGFAYDNIGPFIWSAAAEQRTGVAWRDMLHQRLLQPLGLIRSSARLEDFGEDGVAQCHARATGKWNTVPPKKTATLNAAGGMYTSARDAAKFLGVAMSGGASARGRISATAVRRSLQKTAAQKVSIWGMERDGYGLGWDLGSYNGYRFISRSGGYPGCRAIIYFAPELDLGVVAFSNGGVGANTLHAAIIAQAIDFWTGRLDGAAQRIAATQAEVRKGTDGADAADPRRAAIRAIDPAAWRDVLGDYESPRLGRGALSLENGQLWWTIGVSKVRLHHVGSDSFLADADPEDRAETFDLIRDASGRVVAFMWTDDRYDRLD